jgi:hypothetical protein
MSKGSKPGRPRVEIDLEQFKALAELCPTEEEIGAFFGVDRRTVTRRLKEPAYRQALDEGKATRRTSLKRAQYKAAIGGNTTMLIWLGKQELGQRDQIDVSGPEGKPIQHEHVDLPPRPKTYDEWVRDRLSATFDAPARGVSVDA